MTCSSVAHDGLCAILGFTLFCRVSSSIITRCTITPQFSHKENWQPLTESNGLGYIFTQEHVVPHIGATARFYGFNTTADEEAFASRQLSPPNYKYVDEYEQGVGL